MVSVAVTDFAMRQLSPDFGGTRLDADQMEHCRRLAELSVEMKLDKPGYAPFCREVKTGLVEGVESCLALITPDNAHMLRCVYEARRDTELPVLVRYFVGMARTPAHHLNIILYSREQIHREAAARGEVSDFSADWGIVTVNAEPDAIDSPIPPITMMRNALGAAEGGSGVALDHEAYRASVDYWSRYAQIR